MSKCENCEHSIYDAVWDEYICSKLGCTLNPIWLYKDCDLFKEKEKKS